MIFDEATLRKLNTLTLIATKVRAGAMQGDRRSSKRGTSIEFADYRDYVPGDDLRRLDWNVYARLEKPFIKLFEEEEDLAVHLLLDASQSMDWGEDDYHKFNYGLRLTAALGSIALSAGDQLRVQLLTPGQLPPPYGPARGSQHTLRLLRFLEQLTPGGPTQLNRTLRNYALTAGRPGLTILISDLLDPDGYQPGINHLLSRGHELIVIHLLSPDELDPPLAGDLKLIDAETNHAQEVSLDGGIRALYRRRVRAWQEEIRAYCHQRGIRYLPLSTGTPWDKVVLYQMRREGVVK